MGSYLQKTTLVEMPHSSLFDYSAHTLNGELIHLNKFNTFKSLMVVNVASKCGYTDKYYKEMVSMRKELRDEFGDDSFEIIAFPSGQFKNQEYEKAEEIKKFVENYNVDFPLMEKIDVNGPNTHPIYEFLKFNADSMHTNKGGTTVLNSIGWNFGKFIVDNKGHVVSYHGPLTSPMKIKDTIIKVIKGELHGKTNSSNQNKIDSGTHDPNNKQE